MLRDYDLNQGTMSLYVDKQSAIQISKNLVQHSRTKHIDICHPFIRELVKEGIILLEFIKTKHQVADILTKPLDAKWF